MGALKVCTEGRGLQFAEAVPVAGAYPPGRGSPGGGGLSARQGSPGGAGRTAHFSKTSDWASTP
jgi:hypothetical protein